MIKVTTRGSFRNAQSFLQRMKNRQEFKALYKYGPLGVTALQGATPVEHGETAAGWYYEIEDKPGFFAIRWYNRHVEQGREKRFNVAILIQYGHGTGTGGRVEGHDFINPALKPIFDQMVIDMWREVTK